MENKLKGAILPFRKIEGKLQVGSSTIRCDWLLNHWPDVEEFRYGQEYSFIIYEKAYWPEHAKLFKGVKILDLCDADYLHWGYRTKEMIEEVDAVTCATEALTEEVGRFTEKPVVYVPDRVDLELFKSTKVHEGRAEKVVWFGYSNNFVRLDETIKFLIQHRLELLVISNSGYLPPVGFEKRLKYDTIHFGWDNLIREAVKGDFVLNPQSDVGKWKYKSENKTAISWALGLPVAKTPEDIERFMDPVERKREAEKRYKQVKEEHDVKLSIYQYQALIKEIKNG